MHPDKALHLIRLLPLAACFSLLPETGCGAETPAPAPVAAETIPAGIAVASLEVQPQKIAFHRGVDSAQVLITAKLADGQSVDATRLAQRRISAPILEISPSGLIRPRDNGSAEIVFSFQGKEIALPVTADGCKDPLKADYIRDCMPVISKAGCNAGTCHGAKEGKAGFKLSLRGYDPIFDVRAWTDDAKGRRTNVASPDDSLMLLKATGAVPHEGGQVMPAGSESYQILRAWIADGLKLDMKAPRVAKIDLQPANPVIPLIGGRQQFRVVATYADGLVRDVTADAFVETGNGEVLSADKSGLTTALRRGEAAILARFEGAYSSTVVTVMGDRSGFVWQEPPANNEIDRLVLSKLRRMQTSQSPLCTDYEFVRRVHLDLTGLPPSPEQIRAFVSDPRDSRWKRDELIDRLIGSDDWVEHWANKWADLLQVNSKFLGGEGAKLFRDWIRAEVKANTPYDAFVRKILTASGSNKENPAASYFKVLREPTEIMENTTHLFLATRFNCNKCHDHPFERWTQDQYYQLTAYFAQTGLDRDPASGDRNIGGTAVEGAKPLFEIVVDRPQGEVKHDRTGAVTAPVFPYQTTLAAAGGKSRREQLAAWITNPDNAYFARSFANRIWGYLTGAGIIEPLDDIRAGNPPTNPELLDWLTRQFLAAKFDVRALMRQICQSRTYQLSTISDKWNEDDQINYSHAKPRRLPAETLFDTIYRSAGATTNIPGVAPGTRAAALNDSQINLPDAFLTNLGRPVRESACECERSTDLQMGPIMALVSGPTVGDAISQNGNVLAKLAAETKDERQMVEELFLRFLGRPAKETEMKAALDSFSGLDAHHASLAQSLQKYEAELAPKVQEREQQRQAEIAAAKTDIEKYSAELAAKLAQAEQDRQGRIATAEKALADHEAALAPKQAEWEKQQQGQTGWKVLDARELSSSLAKSVLTKEKDLAIFQSGPDGRQTFTITADTQLESLSGFRLEALADSRIPGNGPGRSGQGNFVLSELEAFWMPQTSPDWKTVREFSFNTPADTEGWKAESVCDLAAENGALAVKIHPNSRKSRIAGACAAPAGAYIAQFRIKSAQRLNQRLYWTTQKDFSAAEPRSAAVSMARGSDEFETIQFAFQTDSDLLGLQLQTDNANVQFSIDSVTLFAGKPVEPQKIALKTALATFSQQGYEAAKAIDGQDSGEPNGWAIYPDGMGKTQMAIFAPAQPLKLPAGGAVLKFVLKQNYPDGKHYLGKFRLSAAQQEGALNFGLPQDVIDVLAIPAEKRSPQQAKLIAAHFRSMDPTVKEKEKALAEARKPLPEDPKLVELKAVLQRREMPLPADPRLEQLRRDAALSQQQLQNKRLICAQDLAWALINNPAFLFNW